MMLPGMIYTIHLEIVRWLVCAIMLFTCVLLLWHSPVIHAQQEIERGQIELLDARFRDVEGGWELLANADIQLSPQMRRGLNSGVPLQFIVEVRVKSSRAYWPDPTLLVHQQRYSLIYYELTRHYRLQSLNSGQSRNFRSLLSALEELGRFNDVVIPRPTPEDDAHQLIAYVSLRLDDKALPLPLQPLFSSKWKLASEDFAWSLN